MWFISIFFKMVLYFYAVLAGAAQLFALKEYRVLIIPLGIIAVVLSIIIYPNSVYQGKWDSTIWPPYMMVSGLVHPLLLLGIAKVRKRFQKKDSR
jgi:spore germination protein KB